MYNKHINCHILMICILICTYLSFSIVALAENSEVPFSDDGTINNAFFGIVKNAKSKEDAIKTSQGIINAIKVACENSDTNNSAHLKLEKGNYLITALDDNIIDLLSNLELDLNGSTIEVLPNSSKEYKVFRIKDQNNIIIKNGTIKGDRENHDYYTINASHEFGHGVHIENSSDIVVKDLEIFDMTGDGIAITGSIIDEKNITKNITIDNNDIHNCRRNGISVITVDGLKIINNEIHNIGGKEKENGTPPRQGIDFERNHTNQYYMNVEISNNRIYNTYSSNIYIHDTAKDFKITNNEFSRTISAGRKNEKNDFPYNLSIEEIMKQNNIKITGNKVIDTKYVEGEFDIKTDDDRVNELNLISDSDAINDYEISISQYSFIYNGERQVPIVTISDENGKNLEEGKDFNVSYSSNSTDEGKKSVYIKLGTEKPSSSNYDAKRTFVINKATMKPSFTFEEGIENNNIPYDGNQHSFFDIKGDIPEDYKIYYSNGEGTQYKLASSWFSNGEVKKEYIDKTTTAKPMFSEVGKHTIYYGIFDTKGNYKPYFSSISITIYIESNEENYSVGNLKFDTLEDAYNAISNKLVSGGIKVLKDVTDSSNFEIEKDKSISIHTDRHIITRTKPIINNGSLKIYGSGIIQTKEIDKNEVDALIDNTGTLMLGNGSTGITLINKGVKDKDYYTVRSLTGSVTLNIANIKIEGEDNSETSVAVIYSDETEYNIVKSGKVQSERKITQKIDNLTKDIKEKENTAKDNIDEGKTTKEEKVNYHEITKEEDKNNNSKIELKENDKNVIKASTENNKTKEEENNSRKEVRGQITEDDLTKDKQVKEKQEIEANEYQETKEESKDEEKQTEEKKDKKEVNIKTENTSKASSQIDTAKKFTDIENDDWYKDSIDYVCNRNIFKGISDTEFGPNNKMTRAMFITALWRLDNCPDVDNNNQFIDVQDDSYYFKALNWATSNKIINGVSDNTFAPDNNLTREDLVTILYRYSFTKKIMNKENGNLELYDDYNNISSYAVEAFKWSVANNIINGRSENQLAPKENGTRAEVATILMRYISDE